MDRYGPSSLNAGPQALNGLGISKYEHSSYENNMSQQHKNAVFHPPVSRRFGMLWHRYSSWALPAFISLFIVLLTWPITLRTGASSLSFDYATQEKRAIASDPPRKSDNLTDVVQWDNYTIFLNDQRMFLQ